MPPRRRVFISHSTRQDAESVAPALLGALEQALAADFDVRVDRTHLRLGERWRHALNTWIGGCDAAVVLLSPRALASSFVAYEASVLAFRAQQGTLTLVPVLVRPVDSAALKACERLRPAEIDETQGIAVADASGIDAVVAAVRARLATVTRRTTSIDERTADLAALLARAPSATLDAYAAALDVDVRAWDSDADVATRLATQLMALGLEGALDVLRGILQLLTPGELTRAIALVAGSWADERTVGLVREAGRAPSPERALALTARQTRTATLLAHRASGLPVGWRVVEVPGAFGEDADEELARSIRANLAEAMRVPEAKLDARLTFYARVGEPQFVALAAAGVDGALARRVAARFPGIVLLLLGADDPTARLALERARIAVGLPPIEPPDEERFWDAVDSATDYLLSFHPNAGDATR